MSLGLIYTVLAVAVMLIVVLLLIYAYPLRLIRRRLICPESERFAEVRLLRAEQSWGRLTPVDVTECSVFAGETVTCSKTCLR